jgi:hypothetical protein
MDRVWTIWLVAYNIFFNIAGSTLSASFGVSGKRYPESTYVGKIGLE